MFSKNLRNFSIFQNGLTLIELIFSLALLSIVFYFGIAISNSLVGHRFIRNYEIAISLAAQVIEAVRVARFKEIGANKDGRKDTLLYDYNSAAQPYDTIEGEGIVPIIKVGNQEFKREVSIYDAPSLIDGVPSSLKVVKVLITWKPPNENSTAIFEVVTTQADLR